MKSYFKFIFLFLLPTISFCMQQPQRPPQIPLIKIQLADQKIEIPKNIAQLSLLIKNSLEFNEKNNIERPIDLTNFDKEQFDIILPLMYLIANNQIRQLQQYLQNLSLVDLLIFIHNADYLNIQILTSNIKKEISEKIKITNVYQSLFAELKNNINFDKIISPDLFQIIKPFITTNSLLWFLTKEYSINHQIYVKNFYDSHDITQAVFNKNGDVIVTKSKHNVLYWDIKSGTLSYKLPITQAAIISALNNDGSLLAICEPIPDSTSNVINIYSTHDGTLKSSTKFNVQQVTQLGFSPDNKFLDYIILNKTFHSINITNELSTLERNMIFVDPITLLISGNNLVVLNSLTSRKNMNIDFNFRYIKKNYNVPLDQHTIFSAWTLSPNELVFVTALGNLIKIWNTKTGRLIKELNIPQPTITKLITFYDNNFLFATAQDNGDIHLWLSKEEFKYKSTLNTHNQNIITLQFSSDGTMLGVGSTDSIISLWDVSSNKSIVDINTNKTAIKSLNFSPDDKHCLVVFADNNQVQLYSTAPEIEQLNLNQLLLLRAIFDAQQHDQKLIFLIGIHDLAIQTYFSLPLVLQNFAKQFLIIRKLFPEELESRQEKIERLEKEIEESKK